MQLSKIRFFLFFLMHVALLLFLQCSKTDSDKATLCGRIFIVYDSQACECVRKQSETILHQIDSLRAVNVSIDRYFTYQRIDWAHEQEAANALAEGFGEQQKVLEEENK